MEGSGRSLTLLILGYKIASRICFICILFFFFGRDLEWERMENKSQVERGKIADYQE